MTFPTPLDPFTCALDFRLKKLAHLALHTDPLCQAKHVNTCDLERKLKILSRNGHS